MGKEERDGKSPPYNSRQQVSHNSQRLQRDEEIAEEEYGTQCNYSLRAGESENGQNENKQKKEKRSSMSPIYLKGPPTH